MEFTRTRGRPRISRPNKDLGTPELIYKRAYGVTEEPLDRCHARDLINDAQHWCGIHFRWLYTLRYGTADPTCTQLDKTLAEHTSWEDDPVWREAREQELEEAVEALLHYHAMPIVRNLCVHHHIPHFLSSSLCKRAFEEGDMRLAHTLNRELQHVRDGLDILVDLWKR